MVLESYQQAQELFLASSVPTAALNVCLCNMSDDSCLLQMQCTVFS